MYIYIYVCIYIHALCTIQPGVSRVLHLFICIYIFTCIHNHVYLQKHTHTHLYIQVYKYIFVHNINIGLWTIQRRLRAFSRVLPVLYTFTNIHVCMIIYIYTHIYAHIHIYIQIHIYTQYTHMGWLRLVGSFKL